MSLAKHLFIQQIGAEYENKAMREPEVMRKKLPQPYLRLAYKQYFILPIVITMTFLGCSGLSMGTVDRRLFIVVATLSLSYLIFQFIINSIRLKQLEIEYQSNPEETIELLRHEFVHLNE